MFYLGSQTSPIRMNGWGRYLYTGVKLKGYKNVSTGGQTGGPLSIPIASLILGTPQLSASSFAFVIELRITFFTGPAVRRTLLEDLPSSFTGIKQEVCVIIQDHFLNLTFPFRVILKSTMLIEMYSWHCKTAITLWLWDQGTKKILAPSR